MRDLLTTNALHWTPAPPNAATSFAFAPGGYIFNGQDCCDVSSLMAWPLGDALVGVTVRQQSDFDLSGWAFYFARAPATTPRSPSPSRQAANGISRNSPWGLMARSPIVAHCVMTGFSAVCARFTSGLTRRIDWQC